MLFSTAAALCLWAWAVYSVRDRPDHGYLPLYHPHFWQLTLSENPTRFLIPRQNLADVSSHDPWPHKLFLKSSQTVFGNKQPWVTDMSLSQVKCAFEGDAGGSSCNEKKDLRLKCLLLTWDANGLPLNNALDGDTTSNGRLLPGKAIPQWG